MHVEIETTRERITWVFAPGDGEPAARGRGQMTGRTFSAVAPRGSIHPDLLILSALLACRPWIAKGGELTSNLRVSEHFASTVRRRQRVRLPSVDQDLAPRTPPSTGRPGLAFSGGVDSVATLALMPPGSRGYFLHRLDPPRRTRRSLYDTTAALQSCAHAERAGYPVTVVGCDVEHLREPVGFPSDLATAIPVLLHADADDLDAIAWGAPLETAHRLQTGVFVDHSRSAFTRAYGQIFAAVGLEVLLPAAGLSEVVTSRVVEEHPLGVAAQSCMRGPALGSPCGRCGKCARKVLLRGAVTGRWPQARDLERILHAREPRSALLAEPMKVELVLAHTIHRHVQDTGGSELTRLLAAKVGGDAYPWLARSYTPVYATLPERYRAEVGRQIADFAEPMTADEEASVRGFDLAPLLGSPERVRAQAALEEWFAAHPVDAAHRLLGRDLPGADRGARLARRAARMGRGLLRSRS